MRPKASRQLPPGMRSIGIGPPLPFLDRYTRTIMRATARKIISKPTEEESIFMLPISIFDGLDVPVQMK